MNIKLAYPLVCMIVASPMYARSPSFVGDLIARDLAGIGRPLGHVGIASAPDYRMRPMVVLEAMDTVPHIQENTIADFKSRSKFWGSKGGLLSPQSYESYIVANRIIRQYYACPEYTLTWRWKEGQIDGNTRPISCGQFRCDTLVNYAYAFSDGYSLPTYNTNWTTPLAIYNYFPVDSDLLIPERATSQSTVVSSNIGTNIASINEANLKQLNADDFYQMLQNSPNISKEEITYLWRLFTSNKIDNNIKILFYDFISFENPMYLMDDIIKQVNDEKGEIRHKLLVILQSIYQYKLENNEQEGLNDIINCFKKLQYIPLDKNDGGIVYRGLATLAPNYLEINNANLTTMDSIHVDILRLKNNRANETGYVQDIIHHLNHPDDRLVVTASYQYLTQLLIDSDLIFFSSASKQLFSNYLDKQPLINHKQSMLYTSAYLDFKAALSANKIEEIPALIYNYMQLLAPNLQDTIRYGLT